MYLFELIRPEYHGPAAAIFAVMYSLGGSAMALLGAVNPLWRINVALMAGFTLVTTFLIGFLVPESPAWLIRDGKETEAASVMTKIRGDQDDFSDVLQQMKELYKERMEQAPSSNKWTLHKPPTSFYFLSILFTFIGWTGFAYISIHGPRVFMVNY